MRQNKNLLSYIVLGLVILAGVFYWLFNSSTVTTPPKSDLPQVAPFEIKNTTLEEKKDGKLVWHLKLDGLKMDAKQRKGTLRGVEGIFYREDGVSIAIKAAAGKLDVLGKEIQLEDDAVGVISTGGTINADKLIWHNKTQLVEAIGNVVIVKGDARATGEQAVMNISTNQAKISGTAKVEKGVKL